MGLCKGNIGRKNMNKPEILVVDDNPLNVELLEGILSDDYGVVAAFDGNGALAEVKKHLPDLILLDVMMPDMSGYEVCKHLKSDGKTLHIPIVMVTALKEKEDRIKGIEAGADDFLCKPVDTYELRVRVKSLLRVKQYHDVLMGEQDKLLVFKSALNSMDDCVAITNTSGDIEYVNPAFEKKYGFSQAELGGKHIGLIKDPQSLLGLDKQSIEQDRKHEWSGNFVGVNKFGRKLNMTMKCSPIIKGNNQINLIFVSRESSLFQ